MNQQQAQEILTINRQSYNTIARLFSQTRQYSWPDFEFFKPYLHKQNDILDIGCGNGRLIEFLKPYIFAYMGVDLSDGLLQEARNKYAEYSFQQGDILTMDIDQKFDVIFSIAVLNHIPTQQLQLQALKSLYNHLKPGGIICMTNWNLWKLSLHKKSIFKYKFKDKISYNEFNKIPLGFKDVITTWKSGKTQVPLYYYAFSKGQIKKYAKKIGFKILENKYSHGSWWKGGNIITVLQK